MRLARAANVQRKQFSSSSSMAHAARSSFALLLRKQCWGRQLVQTQAYTAAHSFHSTALQQQSAPTDRQQQQEQREQQQQQVSTVQKQALSWQELHRAAQIAAWSGLCYVLSDELQARIQQQHAQLTLVAHGRNAFTGWFIVDGVVPHSHFCSTVRQRTAGGSSSSSDSSSSSSSSGYEADGDTDVCAVPRSRRERFIFMRGVQWSAHDIDSSKLSQALMRIWPSHFPRAQSQSRNGTSPGGSSSGSSSSSSSSGSGTSGAAAAEPVPLVAHDGVAELAESMFDQLRPYLDQADDVGMPICFAGHSLGGSLAMLTMVQYQIHSRRRRGNAPSCYTFGSPPVLAHEQGGGGHRVLQALGLPADGVKNFVLENDPVPRALLSVDPTFELLSSWGAVQGLLQLRQLLAGEGCPLSPGRFLFESVGQVHLIKWTPEGGSEVVPLDAHELETELSFLSPKPGGSQKPDASSSSSNSVSTAGSPIEAVDAGSSGTAGGFGAALSKLVSPMKYAQYWLDHHHGSYAQELEAAALRGVKAAGGRAGAAVP